MKDFWGYYENGTYCVGCTGDSVYVYNKNHEELAWFQDFKYAYVGAFLPDSDGFVLKSNAGVLGVYDLKRLELVKKIVINRKIPQDEGFAFSVDGRYFYNIEKVEDFLQTQITIYDTSDFHVAKTLFADREDLFLCEIEFDPQTGNGYILGFARDEEKICQNRFVCRLAEDVIIQMKKLTEEEYMDAMYYKSWERAGFTKKEFRNTIGTVSGRKVRKICLKELFDEKTENIFCL